MASNKNNQPYFVVPASLFPKGQEDGILVRTCDGKGNPSDKGKYRIVRFGARAGALVLETPAKERNAIVVASVLAARQLRENGVKGPAGLVDMPAYLARTGLPTTKEEARAFADEVVKTRAALANPAKRRASAKALLWVD